MSSSLFSPSHSANPQGPRDSGPIANKSQVILPLRRPRIPVVGLVEASQGPTDTGSGGPSQNPKNSTRAGSPSTSRSRHKRSSKRLRRDSSDDSADQTEGGQQPKPLGRKDKDKEDLHLACPYYKRYKGLHCSALCAGPEGWANIARLKEHLTRHHKAEARCQRCGKVFGTVNDNWLHSNQEQRCVKREKTCWGYERYDNPQSDKLRKRVRIDAKKEFVTHQEEYWMSIWDILFPDWDETHDGPKPSPYYDKTPALQLVEFMIRSRSVNAGLHQEVLSLVSGNRDILAHILEIFADHDRASGTTWPGNMSFQRPLAVSTSLDDSIDHPRGESQPPGDLQPATPERRPRLEIVPPSQPGHLAPDYSHSPADSYYTSPITGPSTAFTQLGNGYLMVPGSRASASEMTDDTPVSIRSDWEGPNAPCVSPAPSEAFKIPSQGPGSFSDFVGNTFPESQWPLSGPPQSFGSNIGNVSYMAGSTTNEAFDAAPAAGMNYGVTLSQYPGTQQTMHFHPNIGYSPQSWSNGSQRVEEIRQVMTNTQQNFPNINTTSQYENVGESYGRF